MFNAKGLRTGAALATLLVLVASCADHRLSTESAAPANQPATPNPSATTSPIGQLSDEFAGTVINAEWWQSYGVAGSVRQDDRLIVQLLPNSAEPAGLMTSLPHGLSGSSFAAEISQTAGGTNNTETSISVMTADRAEFVIVSSFGGTLSVWYKRRGENHRQLGSSITFHAGNHRFRRIREQAGTIRVEVSADGTTWTQPSGWSVASPFATLGSLYGSIGARTFDTSNGQPTAAVFEGINTTVPAIPSGVSGTLTAATQAHLTWQDRSVNETGFRIERRASDGAFVEIGTAGSNATQYSDQTLAAGTTYEYRVRAFNGQG
ncbi:MAG: fibronectin type III domain-containing protein, partial [Gemmatimonadetes bacterium]|nr:fibronectin type III domain-containing protein [Gemmatimonadota bacterium]